MAASSSQDFLFEVSLGRLSEELSGVLKAAGLADPGMLEGYRRDDSGELVAAGVTGFWTADITDGGDTTTATTWIQVRPWYVFWSYSFIFLSFSYFSPRSLPLLKHPSLVLSFLHARSHHRWRQLLPLRGRAALHRKLCAPRRKDHYCRCQTLPSQVLVRGGSSLLLLLLRSGPQTSTSSLLARNVSFAGSGAEKLITRRHPQCWRQTLPLRKCCSRPETSTLLSPNASAGGHCWRQTLPLRGSIVPGRFHWYQSWRIHDTSLQNNMKV